MAYYDDYVSRVNVDGSTPTDYFKNLATEMLSEKFKDSPFYKQISIAGTLTDTRIEMSELYNERTLLFPPSTTVAMGSYCTIDSDTWMISEFFKNDIYPKAKIVLCNETLKWKDKSGATFSYACLVNRGRGALSASSGGTFDIELPNGYVYVDVQINADTKTLILNQRFILNGRVYYIEGIDNITQTLNGSGMFKFTMVPDLKINGIDDTTNSIADNSVPLGGSAAGATTPPTGGSLW